MRLCQALRWMRSVVSMGMLLTATTAFAADHVLIMAISNYARAPLPGVRHDPQNALQLAERLGYDTAGATVLRDSDLSGQAMRQALQKLSDQVRSNDRLFFYFSGHGSSALVGSQCSSALVAQDEVLIDTNELKAHLDRLKDRLQDAFIIMDACFSGGHRDLVQGGIGRAANGASPTAMNSLASKAWTPSPGEACDQPVNMSKAWPPRAETARGLRRQPEHNFTFISAASEREIALDDKARGGLATTSLLQCAQNGVPSQGVATASELVDCAQAQVAQEVPRLNAQQGTKWTAHTLELAGNKGRPLIDVRTTPAPSQADPHANNAEKVIALFEQIANDGSDARWRFEVTPTKENVQLNAPEQQRIVRFPYISSQAGYGYVLYVGTDGKDMKQLFPEPGEPNFLPQRGEFPPLRIDGPPGQNTYLFVMSQSPKNFDHVFNNGSAAINSVTTIAVQCELNKRNSGRIKMEGPCSEQRNASRVRLQNTGAELSNFTAKKLTIKGD